jgi:hypothetical protein
MKVDEKAEEEKVPSPQVEEDKGHGKEEADDEEDEEEEDEEEGEGEEGEEPQELQESQESRAMVATLANEVCLLCKSLFLFMLNW